MCSYVAKSRFTSLLQYLIEARDKRRLVQALFFGWGHGSLQIGRMAGYPGEASAIAEFMIEQRTGLLRIVKMRCQLSALKIWFSNQKAGSFCMVNILCCFSGDFLGGNVVFPNRITQLHIS